MLRSISRWSALTVLVFLSCLIAPGAAAQVGNSCWTFYSLPDEQEGGAIRALKALAADDVWAVGGFPGVAHFDGARWSAVPRPDEHKPELQSIDGAAANDVWAAGFYRVDAGGGNQTSVPIVFHWDGRAWQESPSLQFPGELTELYGIRALAHDDVWAVGVHFDLNGKGDLLIEHWDGKSWRLALGFGALGDLGLGWWNGGLRSISGSRDDLWAVGSNLILHWDGQSWRIVLQDDRYTRLWYVAAVPGAVVVAGTDFLEKRGNGDFVRLAAPAKGSMGSLFNAIAADNSGSVWLAGETGSDYNGVGKSPLAWRVRNGQATLVGDTPIAALSGGFFAAVAVAPNDDVWFGGANPQLARYSATCGPPAAASAALTFPLTRYSVWGHFRDYWEAHGGLAQFGYPLSDQIGETSDMDGQTYTVQYFERAVLEYQPQKSPPDDVLVIPLGKLQYAKKYPNGAPGQTANKQNGRYFPASGHFVGGVFRDYWESHGGLAQQGAPLSDEFREVSPLDGRAYTVQYFERSVFELHPENSPPYRVELSHLGLFRGRAKYPFAFPLNGP